MAYAEGTLWPGHPDDAIDAVKPGDVVVLDGRGDTREGLFGDLLTMRVKEMGAAGLVCDMAVRDSPRLEEKGLPPSITSTITSLSAVRAAWSARAT
jgi:regulator of RNase E activity RraA